MSALHQGQTKLFATGINTIAVAFIVIGVAAAPAVSFAPRSSTPYGFARAFAYIPSQTRVRSLKP